MPLYLRSRRNPPTDFDTLAAATDCLTRLRTTEQLPKAPPSAKMAIKYVVLPRITNKALSDFLQLLNPAFKAGQSRAYSPPPLDRLNWTLNREQRLAKWFTTLSPKEKAKIIKDVSQLVLARRTRMCNFLEYKGSVYYSACI